MLQRLMIGLLLFTLPATADVPIPASLLNPLSADEAWNVVRLASANTSRLISENRPLEVPPQISLLSPALRVLARSPVKKGHEAALDGQTAAAFKLVNLIAKEAMAENNAALEGLNVSLQKILAEVAVAFAPGIVNGEIYHCPIHTDVIVNQPGQTCPQCSRRLQARRIPYSFIHARSAKPELRLSLDYAPPRLTLKLRHADGTPLIPEDLWLMHTQSVQVIAEGPGYEHHTAASTDNPGDYVCHFTPDLPGNWKIRAGVTPAGTGLPEYPMAELVIPGQASGPPGSDAEDRAVSVSGFQLQLLVAGNKGPRLLAGQTQILQLQVEDNTGQPVTRLEPLEQAFAHIDAFYAESPTLLQLHPIGGDILREELRGGPGLTFKIYCPEPGWLKLFCRVRIDGKNMTLPFRLQVYP